MSKSKIYTKTGDKGETSLVGGTRLAKCSSRIDLYGDVDELNSHLGHSLALLHSEKYTDADELFSKLQSTLFDLGSRLACEEENWDKFKLPNINVSYIKMMEDSMDDLDSKLPALKNFVLPGGTLAGSYLHISRTSCRAIERKLVKFQVEEKQNLPEYCLEFINRLSDYLFVLSRYVNFKSGDKETLWHS